MILKRRLETSRPIHRTATLVLEPRPFCVMYWNPKTLQCFDLILSSYVPHKPNSSVSQAQDQSMMLDDGAALLMCRTCSLSKQNKSRPVAMILNDWIQQQTLICFTPLKPCSPPSKPSVVHIAQHQRPFAICIKAECISSKERKIITIPTPYQHTQLAAQIVNNKSALNQFLQHVQQNPCLASLDYHVYQNPVTSSHQ